MILAAKDITFGLSRMYVSLMSDCQVTTQVFRNAFDAGDWLGLGIEMESILAETPDLDGILEGGIVRSRSPTSA